MGSGVLLGWWLRVLLFWVGYIWFLWICWVLMFDLSFGFTTLFDLVIGY